MHFVHVLHYSKQIIVCGYAFSIDKTSLYMFPRPSFWELSRTLQEAGDDYNCNYDDKVYIIQK